MIVKARIGAIEFVGDEVRVAVVKTGRKLPQVLELCSRTAVYDSADARFDALALALDEALDALETRPATYVLCVPSTKTIVRSLTIPFKGQARVAKAVPFELEPHLAFPLDELLLDFNVINEIEGTTEVLAVGARRTHLEEQLAILGVAGVEPELASVDAAGLTALWMATRKTSKGLQAVLHVRGQSSVLAIVYNKSLAFFRHLYFGADQIAENPAAIAHELQNTIRAFLAKWRDRGEISSLDITGQQLRTDEAEALENILGMPVRSSVVINQLRGAERALKTAGSGAEANCWEGAIGAAYSAAGGGLPFNLMKDSQQIHGVVRGVVAHLMFSACLALLFLLGLTWYYHEGRLRNEAQNTAIREELRQIDEEIEVMLTEGLGEDVEYGFFSDPPLLDLLMEIGQRMPENRVVINEIRVAQPGARGGWLDITGSSSNASDFNTVFETLKESETFKVAEDTSIRLQGERTTFRVRAFRPEEEIDEIQP